MAQRNVANLAFPLNEEDGFEPGDDRAYRAALAMADRFDAPTIIAFTDALAYLFKMGGQLEIVTLREWVDRDGQPVAKDEPGEYRTLGFSAFYETRDAKIQRAKPPTEALGVPVTGFDAPPSEAEFAEPEEEVLDLSSQTGAEGVSEEPEGAAEPVAALP